MTKAEMLEHIHHIKLEQTQRLLQRIKQSLSEDWGCAARPRADCRGQRLMGFVGIDFDG